MQQYKWTKPIIFAGDQDVHYYDHRGNHMVGECLRVTSVYNNVHGKGIHVAHHRYEMRAENHQRRTHISDEQIIRLG